MATNNTKPSQGASGRNGSFGGDSDQGGWSDTDGFAIGSGSGPQVLAINGFADAEIDVGLQAVVPNDYASIKITLGNLLNLNGFANAAASGTVTSTAATAGSMTISNGNLSGNCSAVFSIDVTAYIAADQTTVRMHIADSFQLSLTGSGYSGATLSETAASGGSVQVAAPPVNDALTSKSGTFDLARFAASVLNTGQWDIAFVASAPGESLKGHGESVLTIDATVELPGKSHPDIRKFQDVERSNIVFNDFSGPAAGMHSGLMVSSSEPLSLFHNV